MGRKRGSGIKVTKRKGYVLKEYRSMEAFRRRLISLWGSK
jgi:hypothetical protein